MSKKYERCLFVGGAADGNMLEVERACDFHVVQESVDLARAFFSGVEKSGPVPERHLYSRFTVSLPVQFYPLEPRFEKLEVFCRSYDELNLWCRDESRRREVEFRRALHDRNR